MKASYISQAQSADMCRASLQDPLDIAIIIVSGVIHTSGLKTTDRLPIS